MGHIECHIGLNNEEAGEPPQSINVEVIATPLLILLTLTALWTLTHWFTQLQFLTQD